jgi:hypothetical protein
LNLCLKLYASTKFVNFKGLLSVEYENIQISEKHVNVTANYTKQSLGNYADLLFTTKSGLGWVYGTACPTGWVLLLILGIISFFSMPCIRKKGFFQVNFKKRYLISSKKFTFSNKTLKVFYLTHWLHLLYYPILIIHAQNYWKWFIVPLTFMVFERIYTCFRIQSASYGETLIKDVNLLSSKVSQN